ncbi:hypothetical protein HMPREF9129_1265 [Peptoniphilus indolicus ATCC 29427]|uniref:Uncharacterized protein n=1 Tax=Peptoniphilus indolicus ATCC 29427 TaxID=997350 RepID=G4D4D5_9FIRM|nr:hypothetical protein HMPREF9129_1265 [Peptoniphilus indolicus ATCC 29427]
MSLNGLNFKFSKLIKILSKYFKATKNSILLFAFYKFYSLCFYTLGILKS